MYPLSPPSVTAASPSVNGLVISNRGAITIRPALSIKPVSPLTTTGNKRVCSSGAWPVDTDVQAESARRVRSVRMWTFLGSRATAANSRRRGRNLSQFQIDQCPIRRLGGHAGPGARLSIHRPEPEDLHESANHQTDLEKAEVLSGADAGAVSETEVQNILGGTALFGENVPSIWCKGVRCKPRQPRPPEVFAPVCVPHVQHNVRSLRNEQLPSICRFNPRVDRRPAWKEVQ